MNSETSAFIFKQDANGFVVAWEAVLEDGDVVSGLDRRENVHQGLILDEIQLLDLRLQRFPVAGGLVSHFEANESDERCSVMGVSSVEERSERWR